MTSNPVAQRVFLPVDRDTDLRATRAQRRPALCRREPRARRSRVILRSRRYHTVLSAHLRGYPLQPPYRHTNPATYLNRRRPAGADGRTPLGPAKKGTANFGLDLVTDSKITLEDFFRFADRFGQ